MTKTPVSKALWYVETHFAEEFSLADVAKVGGVSRFHMSRVFGMLTRVPLMEYVRGRRLSEAARTLAGGAPDILKVALSVGYGSHEAFTRAFHERFGLTPEAIRAQGSFTHLRLTEAQRMDTLPSDMLQPPRFAFVERLRVAGIGARYAQHSIAGIPAQWQRFVPLMDDVRGRIEQTEYGVCTNADEAGTFEYVCGVEVADFEGVPADWSRVEIMQQQYAVFLHSEHISAIRATHQRIWNEWLPASAVQAAAAPDFERYDRSFDPRTGLGGVEIWIPIQAKHAAINERR